MKNRAADGDTIADYMRDIDRTLPRENLKLDLPTLIRIKEAADRPKYREAIAELRVLLEEIEKKQA